MNANDIINGFAHKHRCSRFSQQRMIEALVLELEEIKGSNKTDGYEEPKEDGLDNIITLVEAYSSHDSVMYPKEIVDKLKAWKRLKDKGFKAISSNICGDDFVANFKLPNHADYSQSIDDFDCILGFEGEE